MKHRIKLEDKGQNFLEFIVKDDIIIRAEPFQTEVWKGGSIPTNDVKVGELLPIHKPPHINFGYLKYNVESIEVL